MLNLRNAASIDDDLVESLGAINPEERVAAWKTKKKNIKIFKEIVMKHGLLEQKNRCVWCTLGIGSRARRTPHRDHIAPKEPYSTWTFEVLNIAISCEYCNGFAVKSSLDTVNKISTVYSEIEWRIIHPYFDNTEEHIIFHGADESIIKGLSDRGLWTIDKLKLDDPGLTLERVKDKLFEESLEKLSDDRKAQLLQALGRS